MDSIEFYMLLQFSERPFSNENNLEEVVQLHLPVFVYLDEKIWQAQSIFF